MLHRPASGGTDHAFPRRMRTPGFVLALALVSASASAQPADPPPPADDVAPAAPREDGPDDPPFRDDDADGSASVAAPANAQVQAPVPAPLAAPRSPSIAADVPAEADSEPLTLLTDEPAKPTTGFQFGSYGRVGVGTDLRGSTPESINVVSHGSRVVEPTYLELDLYYRLLARRNVELTTVTTLAFGDQLFHLTGEFDATVALRNFYLQARKDEVSVWAGSRMYRGDDIYLLDYWPLDDTNTVGGGVEYATGPMSAAAHVGINRPVDAFFLQTRNVLAPGSFGAEEITQLDRQRYIASLKGSYRFFGPETGGFAMRGKLYVDGQAVGEGTREFDGDPGVFEELPADFGFSVGAQLSSWGFGSGATHANAFVRWSQGLSAFDELNPPMAISASRKSFPGASEFLVAASGNYEFTDIGGVMAAAYARRFIDGDPNTLDRDDGWEYIGVVRPRAKLVKDIEAAVDLSFQARFPRGVSPNELIAMDPAVFQVAPMLTYAPYGSGSYARPQFRLVYRAGHLNEGARDLYPLDDPRRSRSWVHYFGLQAEWWFNSTYR